MSQGLLWMTIIIIGLLTLAIRLSFLMSVGKMQIAPVVRQALRFVPVAVLSALIAPALFFPKSSLDLSPGNVRLIAGIIAIIIAWRTKNVLLTIAIGMTSLLILQAFVPSH